MSGIAGIVQFDGSPVDPEPLRAITDAMAHRGRDGAGYWVQGLAGLGHRPFWTTPEALAECQPLHDPRGGLCLVFDGRLDNREELATALRGTGAALRDGTDAELVLRAYEAWGEDSPRRLLGDFAYAIWDGSRRRLFLARDVMGVRPLHYFRGASFFAFASELQALFHHPGIRATPNEGMIAEHLAWQITSHEETLYEGIRRLPLAHCMSLDASGGQRAWRYWEVDFARRLACRSDAEFSEQFLAILRECVRDRLRSHGSVRSDLSGGLDSSTVSVVANGLLAETGIDRERFRTFSVAYPGLPCDESEFIRATLGHAGLAGDLVELEPLPANHYGRVIAKFREFPGYPGGEEFLLGVMRATAGRGCRVILTGHGGNEWLEGSPDYLADLVAGGAWLDAWRVARGNSGPLGCSAARIVYRHAIRPLWRDRFDRPVRLASELPHLNGHWVESTRLGERLGCAVPVPPGGSRMQAETYRWTFAGHQVHSYELLDLHGQDAGFEFRHPMLDRRMIEFGFALPGDQRWRDGKPKTVLRNAMTGRLPRVVLERAVQADFTVLFAEALETVRARWPMREWAVCRLGWVDHEVLEKLYADAVRQYRDRGTWRGRVFWRTWMAYGMSLWAMEEGLDGSA